METATNISSTTKHLHCNIEQEFVNSDASSASSGNPQSYDMDCGSSSDGEEKKDGIKYLFGAVALFHKVCRHGNWSLARELLQFLSGSKLNAQEYKSRHYNNISEDIKNETARVKRLYIATVLGNLSMTTSYKVMENHGFSLWNRQL